MKVKTRLRSILVVVVAFALVLGAAVASLFVQRTKQGNVIEVVADNVYTELKNALVSAADDFETQTSLGLIGATDGYDVELTGDPLTISTGKRIRLYGKEDSDNPFTSKESWLNITGKIEIAAQAELVLDMPVILSEGASITVNGTLVINDIFMNAGTLITANVEQEGEALESRGIVINGSLNNDAYSGGIITVPKDEKDTVLVPGHCTISPGAALVLKWSDAATNASFNLDGGVKLFNNGTIIKQDGGHADPAVQSGSTGSIISSAFIAPSALTTGNNANGRRIFYVPMQDNPTPGRQSHTLTGVTTLQAAKWYSFGRTTFVSGNSGAVFQVASGKTANLGGEVIEDSNTYNGKTATQGANELIFDGGAAWTKGTNGADTVYFLDGATNAQRTAYYNAGVWHTVAHITVVGDLNLYSGVKIVNHETRAGTDVGGAIKVNSNATLNLYGGEISRNAVTKCGNSGAGAGILGVINSTIKIAGGKVTRNSVNSDYNVAERSADGAGIAVTDGALSMSAGEISFNCGAQHVAADGGGVIMRAGEHKSESNQPVFYFTGGSISDNWTGGYGGGVLLWQSKLIMSKSEHGTPEIVRNGASFGGGVGMTSETESARGAVEISGGVIRGNYAFARGTGNTVVGTATGGYGGGICVGSELGSNASGSREKFKRYSYAQFSGDALVTDNYAVYGGGLAVYSMDEANNNYLSMTGGKITNNLAYNSVTADGTVGTHTSVNGDGVYFTNKSDSFVTGAPLLQLSGDAQIDSSNNVSFDFNQIREASEGFFGKTDEEIWGGLKAPIQVTGELTCSGVAGLITLQGDMNKWQYAKIISFDDAAMTSANLNKFLFDSTERRFVVSDTALKIAPIANAEVSSSVHLYTDGQYVASYKYLEDAVTAAAQNGTETDEIVLTQNITLTEPIEIKENLTISVAWDKVTADSASTGANGATMDDISIFVAEGFNYGTLTLPSLFFVQSGKTLTLQGDTTNDKWLVLDGNYSVSSGISLISLMTGGKYVQGENVRLRNNNNANGQAGALYISGGATAEILGGEITKTSGEYGAVYVAESATLNLKGGRIFDNASERGKTSIQMSGTMYMSGTVYLEDEVFAGGAIYLEKGFSSDSPVYLNFDPQGRSSGFSFVRVSKDWLADNPTVDLAQKFLVSTQFTGEDIYLTVATPTGEGADLNYPTQIVLDKPTKFRFYYHYNGSSANPVNNVVFADDYIKILDSTYQLRKNFLLRGDKGIEIILHYGESLQNLTVLSDFATRAGYSLVNWKCESDTSIPTIAYDDQLSHRDSEVVLNMYAVWSANTFFVTYDKNIASVASANDTLIQGNMSVSEFAIDHTSNPLPQTGYVFKGYVFSGWQVGEKTFAVGEDFFGDPNFRPTQHATAHGSGEDRSQFDITLKAVWTPLFSGGVGTSSAPFQITTLQDLYRLEATVMGAHEGSDKNYHVPDGYFNSLSNAGAAQYTSDDYSGSRFVLTQNIGTAATPFTGVIGRIATDGEYAPEVNQHYNIAHAVYGMYETAPLAVIEGNGVAQGTAFKGNFFGDNKTIYLAINKEKVGDGATVSLPGGGTATNGDESLSGVGLFGYIDHATITDLKLEGSVHGYAHVGSLVGYAFGGTISSIYNMADVTSSGQDVGGIIGDFFERSNNYSSSDVLDVYNEGTVTFAPRTAENDLTRRLAIETEWSETDIVEDVPGIRYGGIVGAGVSLNLTNGYNYGAVTARFNVGGIVGALRSFNTSTAESAVVEGGFNKAKITATSGQFSFSKMANDYTQQFITAYTGGIVGRLVGVSSVRHSFNAGEVIADYVARIDQEGQGTGTTRYEYVPLEQVPRVGNTQDSGLYFGARGVGGVVGFTSHDALIDTGRMAISDVYNTGNVSSWAGVGGICGYLSYANVNNSFNAGNVTAFGSHWDASRGVRAVGGYEVESLTDPNAPSLWLSYMGAVVGRGISAALQATVSYNTNVTYTGFSDATVQAIGDSRYNPQLGLAENESAARALTSTQMRVSSETEPPLGFSATFNRMGWAFKLYEGEAYYYYPQIERFTSPTTIAGETLTIVEDSKELSVIKYRDEQEGDTPITSAKRFKLTFMLNDGDFVFNGTTANTFAGLKKVYTAVEGGDGYLYEFVFPHDNVNYPQGTQSDSLERPNDPQRVGYRFVDWYIDPGFTTQFNFGAIPGQDTTVYARWAPVEYTIVYENVYGLGGAITGDFVQSFDVEMADRATFAGGDEFSSVQRRGYTFSGWEYFSERQNKYIDVFSFEMGVDSDGDLCISLYNENSGQVEQVKLSALTTGQLTLRAKWTPTSYSITYELGSGFVDGKFPAFDVPPSEIGLNAYTVASDSMELVAPKKHGYEFQGWKLISITDESGLNLAGDSFNASRYTVGNNVVTIYQGSVGNFVLQAQWKIRTVTVYLNPGSGTIENPEQYGLTAHANRTLSYEANYYDTFENKLFKTTETGETYAFQPVRTDGRTFAGWYLMSSPDPAQDEMITSSGHVDPGETAPQFAITLFAGYTINRYKLTIEVGGTAEQNVTILESGYEPLQTLQFTIEDNDTLTIEVDHGTDASMLLTSIVQYLDRGELNFSGWDADGYLNVTQALTINAQYSMSNVTVIFAGRAGTILDTISVQKGKTIKEMGELGYDAATKYAALLTSSDVTNVVGYIFNNQWTYGENQIFTDSTPVQDTIIVYADYTAKIITPAFSVKVGEQGEITPVTVTGYTYTYDQALGSLPTLEELEAAAGEGTDYLGYGIVQWYYVPAGGGAAVPVFAEDALTSEMIAWAQSDQQKDTISLYAELVKTNYTITFDARTGQFANGSRTYETTYTYNGSILLDTPPTYTGHSLQLWTIFGGAQQLGTVNSGDNFEADFLALLKTNRYVGEVMALATWMINSYEVWFSANDGAFTVSAVAGVTFYQSDKATVATTGTAPFAKMSVDHGVTPSLPSGVAVNREGYSFTSWTHGNSPVLGVLDDKTYTKDNPITANWRAREFTVVFVTNGADAIADKTFLYGEALSGSKFPTDPTRTGYDFGGWFTDNNIWNAAKPNNMPAKNLTLYAKWTIRSHALTLNFNLPEGLDANAASTAIQAKLTDIPVTFTWSVSGQVVTATASGENVVAYNTSISAFNFLTFTVGTDTYQVGVWQEGSTNIVLDRMPDGALTASTTVSKTTASIINVNFHRNDGTSDLHMTASVQEGQKITNMSDPVREGHHFEGWFTNKEGAGSAFDLKNTAIDGSVLNLYAKWFVLSYQATFVTDSAPIPSRSIPYGTPITDEPAARAGYSFEGWYLDSQFNQEATTMPAADTTFYANWIAVDYKFHFTNYGEGLAGDKLTGKLVIDTEIPYPTAAETAQKYYQFVGWIIVSDDPNFNGKEFDEKLVPNLASIGGKTDGNTVTLTLEAKYSEQPYSIAYHEVTGTPAGIAALSVTISTVASNQPLAQLGKKTGYQFVGWTLNGIGTAVYTHYSVTETGVAFATSDTGDNAYTIKFEELSNNVLVAKYEPLMITVSFDANGGTLTGASSIQVPFEGTFENLPADPEYKGYTFGTWETAAGDAVTRTTKLTQDMVTWAASGEGSLTLKATWQAKTVNIIFNPQNGSALSSFTGTYGEAIGDILNDNAVKAPEYTGYHFDGWFTATGKDVWETTTTLTAQNGVGVEGVIPTLTLYAHWTANEYTVTLAGSNVTTSSGDNGTLTQTATHGKAYTLTLKAATGYDLPATVTFALTTGGTSTPIPVLEGGIVMVLAENVTGNFTITAVATIKTYSVSFNGINVTHEGDLTDATYGQDYTLTLKAATGHTLPTSVTVTVGGTTLTAGTNTYSYDAQSGKLVIDSAAFTGSIVIEATATPNALTVDLQGAHVSSSPSPTPSAAYGQQYVITLRSEVGYTQPTITSITVGETTLTVNDDYTYSNGLLTIFKEKVTDEITIVAAAAPLNYTLTLDANEGTLTGDSEFSYAYTAAVTKPADPTRTGYTFAGWTYLGVAVSSPTLTFSFTMPASDVTLVAQWTPQRYDVEIVSSFITPTGVITGAATHGESYTITFAHATGYRVPETAYVTIGNGTREEHELEGNKLTIVGTKVTGKIKIEIHGTAEQYSVTLDLNYEDAAEPTSSLKTFGQPYDIEDPTRTNYTFLGWWMQKTGGERIYSDTLVATAAAHTLYAHWALNEYTVSFDEAGGSAVKDQTIAHGSFASDPGIDENSRTGYTFLGWFLGEATTEFDFTNTAITGDITLTARWDAIEYTIAYNTDGGSTPTPTEYTVEQTIILAESQKVGYIFQGWFDQETNGTKISIIQAGTTGTVTLYARWTARPVIVVFDRQDGTTTSRQGTYDAKLGTLPTAPDRLGYTFQGWWTQAEGGKEVSADSVLTAALGVNVEVDPLRITLYAHWEAKSNNVTLSATNATLTPPASGLTATVGVDYVVTVEKAVGYEPPTQVRVKIGSSEFTLDVEEGKVTIPGRYIVDDITITAEGTAEQYGVTIAGENLSTTEAHKATYGQAYTITLTPKTGYALPAQASVKVGTNGTPFPVNIVNGSVTIDQEYITDAFTITANATASLYAVTLAGDNMKNVGPQARVAYGTAFSLQVAAQDGYTIDSTTLRVWMAGSELDEKNFTFSASTNTVSITGLTVTGEIIVYISATGNEYAVTKTGEGVQFVTLTGADKATHGAQYVFTLTAEEGYDPPKSISVTIGGTEAEYAVRTNGTVVIPAEDVTGAIVVVEAKGTLRTYTVTLTLTMPTADAAQAQKIIAAVNSGLTDWTMNSSVNGETITININQVAHGTAAGAGGLALDSILAGIGALGDSSEYVFTWTTAPNGTISNENKMFAGAWSNDDVRIVEFLSEGVVVDSKLATKGADGNFTYTATGGFTQPEARLGYVFTGWTAGENCTLDLEANTVTIAATAEVTKVTITANWQAIEYTLTLDLAGGTGTESLTFYYIGGAFVSAATNGTAVTLAAPTKTGHTFAGWSVSTGTYQTLEDIFEAGVFAHTENAEAHKWSASATALWTPKTYTVVFSGGEGSVGSTVGQEFTFGVAEKLEGDVYYKLGYDFMGWALTAGATEVAYESGKSFTVDETLLNAAQVGEQDRIFLHAVWNEMVYTLNYVDGDVTDTITLKYATDRDKFVLESSTKTGYDFDGWALEKDGRVVYEGGQNVRSLVTGVESQAERTLTLYAIWTAHRYNVTLSGELSNAGTFQQVADHGEEYSVPLTAATGYGLPDKASVKVGTAGTPFDVNIENGSVTIEAAKVTGDITITVVGVALKFNLNFIGEDVSITSKQVAFGTMLSTVLPEDPTRTGYTFDYWTYQNEELPADFTMPAGDVTLTAKWRVDEYEVTVGGENIPTYTPDKATFNTDYVITLTANEHYEITKVAVTVNKQAITAFSFENGQLTISKDAINGAIAITLTTAPVDYVVTFDGTGLTYDGTLSATYGTDYTLTLVAEDGYTLPTSKDAITVLVGGVKADFSFDTDTITIAGTKITDVVAITATGVINQYTVAFNLTNITIESGNITTIEHGKAFTFKLKANVGYSLPGTVKFERAGTDAASIDIDIPTSNEITILAPLVTGNITISAEGVAHTYDVTVTGHVKEAGTYKNAATFGADYTLKLNAADGYEISKAYVTIAGSSKSETTLSNFTLTIPKANINGEVGTTITIDVECTAISYNIVYNGLEEGDTHPNPASYTVEQGVLLKDATRFGYTFDGWFTSATGGTQVFVINTGRTGAVTLYARWTARPVDITYIISKDDGISSLDSGTYGQEIIDFVHNQPHRDGYEFDGWYVTIQGKETKWDSTTMTLTQTYGVSEINGTLRLTLTAHWTALPYDVTWSNSTNVTVSGKISATHNAAYSFTLTAVTGYDLPTQVLVKIGEKQAALYDVEDGTVSIPAEDVTGDIVITAEGVAKKFTVSFDADGGTFAEGEGEDQSVDYNTTATRPANPSKKGYTFKGWTLNGNAFSFTTAITSATTLKATWAIETYTITYVLLGGTNDSSNPGSYTIESEIITLAKPTRTGYTCSDWYTSREGGEVVTQIAKGSTGNLVLYARWVADTYTVSLAPADQETVKVTYKSTATYGEKYEFTLAEVTGYALPTSVTVRIGDEDHPYAVVGGKVSIPAADVTGDIVITAEGTLRSYDVALVLTLPVQNSGLSAQLESYLRSALSSYRLTVQVAENEASLTVTIHGMSHGTALDSIANLFNASQFSQIEIGGQVYLFAWSTTPNDTVSETNKSFAGGWSNEDVRILTFKVEGAMHATGTVIKKNGAFVYDLSNVAAPERAGYRFMGWTADGCTISDGKLTISAEAAAESNEITVNATWQAIEYTLTIQKGTESETLTFYYIGEAFVSAETEGTAVTLATPTKTGHTFAGWKVGESAYFSLAAIFEANVFTATTDANKWSATVTEDWTANKYTVTFDGGKDALGGMAVQTFTFGEAQTLSQNAYVRVGYDFKEWKAADGSTYEIDASFTFTKEGDVTLTAQWTPKQYTVAYAGDDVSLDNDTQDYTGTFTLATPTRNGYNFSGWSTDGGTTAVYNGGAVVSVAALFTGLEEQGTARTITLTAVWTPITYTITYVLDGGTNDSNNPTSYTIESETITLGDATNKTGYTFEAWYDQANGGNAVTEIEKGSMGNITLYARWTVNEYTVTVNAGEGGSFTRIPEGVTSSTGTSGNYTSFTIDRAHGSNVFADVLSTLQVKAPEYRNLASWSTEDNAALFFLDGAITITAQYANGQVSVSLVLPDGSVESTTVTYNTSYTPKTETVVPGYTITGWKDGAGVSVTSQIITQPTAFYAVYTRTQYTVTKPTNVNVTFNGIEGAQHGEVYQASILPKDGYKIDSVTVKVGEAELKSGFTYENGLLTIEASKVTGDITITVATSEREFTLSFSGESVSIASKQVAYGTKLSTVLPTDPTRTGYTFGGWQINGASVDLETYTMPAGDITIVAAWNIQTFTVTFQDGDSTSTQTIAYGEKAVEPVTADKKGYDFGGWKKDGSDFDFETAITANVTLTAQWDLIPYTITYVLDGGTNAAGNPTSYNIESEIITLGDATNKTGYTFSAWYDEASGGKEVTEIEKGSTGNITLYARWTVNEYKVTFDTVQGSVIAAQSVDYNTKATRPADPTKPGYTFKGWKLGGNAFSFDTLITSNITLTATWQLETYTITYVLGGGVNAAGNPDSYTVTSDTITLADPTRTGYDFDGWYDAEKDGNKVTTIAQGSTGNKTLYARWTEEKYDVSVTVDGGEPSSEAQATYNTEYSIALSAADYHHIANVAVSVGGTALTDGYTFTNGKLIISSAKVTGTIAITVTTAANTYDVDFNGTNVGYSGTLSATYGTDYTLTLTAVTGYDLPTEITVTVNGSDVTFSYVEGVLTIDGDLITGDIVITAAGNAKQFTVTFNAEGGALAAGETGTQKVSYNTKATRPADPTKKGYAFTGWELGGNAFSFDTLITSNIELTATWQLETYTITYVLGGGVNAAGNPDSYTVTSDTITLADPTLTGYDFEAWYDAEKGGNQVTEIAAGSAGNITLYARWNAIMFLVTFDANGGTLAQGEETQSVISGGTLAFVEPTRVGYRFDGWFTDDSFTQRYDFNAAVTSSFTLIAKWKITVVTGVAQNGVVVTVTSEEGFEDGVRLEFVNIDDEELLESARGSLAKNMTLATLYDIKLVNADGSPVSILKPLTISLSAEGLPEAEGKYTVVFISEDGRVEEMATHVEDAFLYFIVTHFSYYAIVDMLPLSGGSTFAWWWILVAVVACLVIMAIIVYFKKRGKRFELTCVGGGMPARKLKQDALIDLPIPEREEEVFEGWYYDETFTEPAMVSAMPSQNLILYAKWRRMTDEERIARDRMRAEADEGYHAAAPVEDAPEEQPAPRELDSD